MQESQAAENFKSWIMSLDPRLVAILVGLSIGVLGGLLGLLLVTVGPLITIIVIAVLLGALYVLTDVKPALFGTMALLVLLPYGTFPYKILVTPTLLDLALGAFVAVYVIQWVTGRRRNLKLVQPHIFIAIYLMWIS